MAATNRERLAAISDGIFAVGMTLLVLGLAVPASAVVHEHSESELWQALVQLGPSIVTYALSFLTLGIFWVGQQTQLSQLDRTDRNYAWLQLAFLLFVTLVPFSTALLARFWWSRIALVEYWLNIFMLGIALLAALEYGLRSHLFPAAEQATVARLVRRRIFTAQAMYGAAMLLCVIDTRISIGLIVLIQLNYAIAPRIPILSKL